MSGSIISFKCRVTDDGGNTLSQRRIKIPCMDGNVESIGSYRENWSWFQSRIDLSGTPTMFFVVDHGFDAAAIMNLNRWGYDSENCFMIAHDTIRRIYLDDKHYIRLSVSGSGSATSSSYSILFQYYYNDTLYYTFRNSSTYTINSYRYFISGPTLSFLSQDLSVIQPIWISIGYDYHLVDGLMVPYGDPYGTLYFYPNTSSTDIASFKNWLVGLKIQDDDNPYWEGGTSEEGGGGGNFSEDSDDVDVDQLPIIDAVGTGFATLFTPTKSQLTALADVMWNNNVFTALQNLVENITGMFTSLAIVPFEVTAGQTVEVTWFGLPITEIFLTLASKQYYEFDMGSINMAEDNRIYTSGSALDYSPFSTLGIFLPFIGFQELDIDECRDAVIGLKYRIDILSGTCVALISLNGNTIYQFTGNCLSQIPITNENMQSLVTDAVQVGIAAAATHSAKGAVGAAESSMSEAETAKETKAAKAALGHAEAHLAQTKAGLASATANASMGMKPVYGKAGAISASASLLAVKQPYLFLRTPRQSIPEHYQRYCGFPSNISGKLSSFSGYTVVEDIRLNGLVATSPEVAEIYELLKGGVII